MATNTTVQTTVLDVETGKSVQNVKSLKQEIRDLKDRIVELNSAGEDCTEEMAELGTKMRLFKDINEEAMLSSRDLGDQLAVASGAMKGMAGAVSTVTGLMGMMGVESEKGTKLLRTMASAMSITSGIQAMESGYKALRSMVTGFAAATKGAKTFGAAMKAAFSSNPIGLIITAVTTLITLLGSAASRAKELEGNLKNSAESDLSALKNFNSSMLDIAKETARRLMRMSEKEVEEFINNSKAAETAITATLNISPMIDNNEDAIRRHLSNLANLEETYEKQIAGLQGKAAHNLMILTQIYGEDISKYTEKELAEYNNKVIKYIRQAAAVAVTEKNTLITFVQGLKQAATKEMSIYPEINEKLSTYRKEYAEAVKKFNEVAEEPTKNEEAAAERRKKEAEEKRKINEEAYNKAVAAAKQWVETQKKNISEELSLQQAKAKRLYDLEVQELDRRLYEGEMTQEKYYAERLKTDEKYYTDSQSQMETYINNMNALVEEAKKNRYLQSEAKKGKYDILGIFTPADLENVKQTIDDLFREIIAARRQYSEESADYRIGNKEVEDTIKFNKMQNDIEAYYLKERLKLEMEYAEQKWWVSKDLNKKELELLEQERKQEDIMYELFREQQYASAQTLKESFDSKLISEQEYNQRKAELMIQDAERAMEHSEKLVEFKKRESEAKKNIQNEYWAFEESVASSTSSILNTIADSLGESNEHYKNIKIAATLIDTFQSSMAAYSGMVQSIPGPPGIIAGALAAAASVATGIATVNKIKAIDPKGTTSSSAVQTFTTPRQATIATGANSDYTDIMGRTIENSNKNSKVYVVLNDINEAEDRRVQVVNSNTY